MTSIASPRLPMTTMARGVARAIAIQPVPVRGSVLRTRTAGHQRLQAAADAPDQAGLVGGRRIGGRGFRRGLAGGDLGRTGRALRRTCRPLARRLRRSGLRASGCGLAVGQLPATAAPATLARRPCGVAFARAGNGFGRGRFGLRTRGALGAGRGGGVGGRRGPAARAAGTAAAPATAAFTAAATAAAARAGAPATAATALLVGRALLARLLEARADAFLFAVLTLDRLAHRAWQGDQQ